MINKKENEKSNVTREMNVNYLDSSYYEVFILNKSTREAKKETFI
jgi:hypothetical protein